MPYNNLGLLVDEVSKLFGAVITVLQDLRLLDFHLSTYLTNQILDGNRSWRKMVFAESKHEENCYKQTPLVVNTRSSHLVDS